MCWSFHKFDFKYFKNHSVLLQLFVLCLQKKYDSTSTQLASFTWVFISSCLSQNQFEPSFIKIHLNNLPARHQLLLISPGRHRRTVFPQIPQTRHDFIYTNVKSINTLQNKCSQLLSVLFYSFIHQNNEDIQYHDISNFFTLYKCFT